MNALTSLKDLKKIGFIVPSSNTALEPLTVAIASSINDRVSFHFSRVVVGRIDLDAASVEQFQAEKITDVAGLLSHSKLDAILWNGTSGSWSGKGIEEEELLSSKISHISKCPASTSTLALVEVLKLFEFKRFSIAVPYVEGPTGALCDFYEQQGYTVVKTARLDESENVKIANLPLEKIRQVIRDCDSPDAQCIIIPCTNFPSALVVEEMEAALGKPIFDSIIVTLWKSLQMVGVTVPLFGWGKLLRWNPTLAKLDAAMEILLRRCKASRTTLRADIPAYNCHCNTVCAEAVASSIAPLRLNSSLNQRALATVQWLEQTHKVLVQDDCEDAQVKPTKALMQVYGVKAQMLAPIIIHGELRAWISVHHVGDVRHWLPEEVSSIEDAVKEARRILTGDGWLADI